MHVVCRWIGNSQPVAAKHYLQLTDEHFERAAASTPEALQNPVQQVAVEPCEGSQPILTEPKNAALCESLPQSAERQAAQLGHAHPRKTRGKVHVSPKALQNPVHLPRIGAAIGE